MTDVLGVGWGLMFVALAVLGVLRQQPVLFMASLTMLAISCTVRAWGRVALKGVSLKKRINPSRVFPGESASLTISLENRKLLPAPWVWLEEDVPDGIELRGGRLGLHHRQGRKRLLSFFSLGCYQRVNREYRIRIDRRGYYSFGPTKLTCGDPFGLYKESLVFEDQVNLLVYPGILPVESLRLVPAHPLGTAGASDPLFEDPTSIAGIRDYDPGDDFRRIHWKASARMGKLQAKVYEPRTDTQVAIFVDGASHDPPWLRADMDVIDRTVVVGASILNHCLERRFVTGVFSNGFVMGSGMELAIPPGRSPDLFEQAMEGLARLWIPTRSIADVLDLETPRLPAGCGVVIVTAFLNERLRGSILRVRGAGRWVEVFLVTSDDRVEAVPGAAVYRVRWDGGEGLEMERE